MVEGVNVWVFCYYNFFNFWGWFDILFKEELMKVEVFIGDICDFNGVCMVMKDIDVVFYLVVLIVIFFSYYLFDVYIDINVKGIFNVI